MNTTTTLAELAGIAYDQFETRTRDGSDESFVTLKDTAPDWLRELVHEAHGDMLPDDWRYECIQDALGFIHDNDADEDSSHEFADQAVDVYTGSRLAWLASHLNRPNYCDEAADEGLVSPDTDIVTRIGVGQYMEAQEVYASVVSSLQDKLAE